MRCLLVILVLWLAAMNSAAQVAVSGVVIDKETTEPLTGASVIVKGADGKIKKYTTSKADGGFAIPITDVTDCRLEVSMIGFSKKVIPLDSIHFPLTILLEPGKTILKEVTVKAERIREQGDTITYNVGSFSQTQDRSIGDVLKRMPGIDVAKNGKIQYQGEDINKFYIEGSDLLGGKYGIATNGINHDDVGAVEVMENHQPLQVLSGMAFSDKAAINLKLKNKAKATWSVHGNAGGGYSQQPEGAIWYGQLFVMAVMPGYQNITTLKTNNIGDDLSAQSTDFFAGRRGTDLKRYIALSLPGVPTLSEKRTLFNRSALVSTNSLWKSGRGELKAQVDYAFNHINTDAVNITTYFLSNGDRVVTENRNGTDRSHALSAKVIYELNGKTAFLNNTLRTNIDWDDIRLGTTGSLPNDQSASLPDYYVANDFKLIKRFRDKHLVTFTSNNEWESLPQTLAVTVGNDRLRQHVRDRAFYTNESAAYAFTVKGLSISLEGGVKGYLRSMNSSLTDLSEFSVLSGLPITNVLNTNYLTVHATPKLEYWLKHVNLILSTPLSFAHYTFDKAIVNRSEAYFAPTLHLNWKPGNRFTIAFRGNAGRSPMALDLILPGVIMTDYRSFRSGVDNFYTSNSQNISATVAYKHTRRGLFANGFVMQSWRHVPYTLAQQLLGDYIVYSYSSARSSGKSLMTSANIGKTLDFIRGSANVNASYNHSESHLLFENRPVNSVGTSWSVGAKISGSPARWLSFDYRFVWESTRLAMNAENASWLGSMKNEALLNLMPHSNWEWHIIGEHYRNAIETNTIKNLLLLDTKVNYKLSKRLELSALLSNIFNQRTYNYTVYNQLNSFESQRRLRGRELLITLTLRK